jgi:hypothetical protein
MPDSVKQFTFLMELLRRARDEVPAMRFAIALAGLIAVAAIGLLLVGKTWAALISCASVLIGMILLFVFSRLVASKSAQIQIAGIFLLWSVVITFMTFLVFTLGAVSVGIPSGWARILGLQTVVERTEHPSDLVISSFTDDRVRPLKGRPIIQAEGPVYAEGVQISITLAHNLIGTEKITILKIAPLVTFTAGANPALAYSIPSDAIGGTGIIEPRRFIVRLNGPEAPSAAWLNDKGESQPAESDNLLAVPNRALLSLNNQDSVENLEISVVAVRAGTYDVAFAISYVSGADDRQMKTRSIRIYKK